MGKNPADRVKTLLVKLDTIRRSKKRRSTFTNQTRRLSNKFIGQVEKVFTSIPKQLDWLSFFNNDLPIVVDITEEVREVSNQNDGRCFHTSSFGRLSFNINKLNRSDPAEYPVKV
jgi:glycerol-3-phosphate cytidylyltransferase-like family protein